MYENDKSPIPSLPGTADSQNMPSGAKISLKFLPPGVKQGDEVSLKVTHVDAAQDCAYVTSEDDGSDTGSKEGEDQDENGTGETGSTPDKVIDTSLTLGPMSKLKNYLAQKSVETQSQI